MNEIKYRDVVNTALGEVGYQGSKMNSKYTEFLDSIDWYNYKKKNACTWCCIFVDYCIAVNKGNLSYEQARVIDCEPANHSSNAGAGVKDKAKYFKNANRWIDKANYKEATTGDQIFLDDLGHVGLIVDWDKTGFFVVDGSTTYEGKPNSVGKKHIPFRSNRIVGFGRPDWYKYQTEDNAASTTPAAPSTSKEDLYISLAKDCYRGKYGNGLDRKRKINSLGYGNIYDKVQAYVNMICRGQLKP